MRELLIDQPMFVGFKVSKQLRELLDDLDDANRKYISAEGSTFLRICREGEDLYVGKIVDGRLTTDKVEDIRRNVLSIVRRVGHGSGLPTNLLILACRSMSEDNAVAEGDHLT